MPVGHHHFYRHDMKECLRKAVECGSVPKVKASLVGDVAKAEEAFKVAVEVAEVARKRLEKADKALLVDLYPVLRPYMRACHQKRLDVEILEPDKSNHMRPAYWPEHI